MPLIIIRGETMKNYYYYLAITALLIVIIVIFNRCNEPDAMSRKTERAPIVVSA